LGAEGKARKPAEGIIAMQLESVALTNVGLVRSMNQDAILSLADKGVFLVADGMGGEKAGEEASAQVVETIQERFEAFFQEAPEGPSRIEGEMRDGLLKANRDVFQISVREPDKRGLGSTSSLLCLHRGVYVAAQVGDSRIYLLREGNVQQITRDHTLVWALYEQGAITREMLETHPDRHLLTQCIGNERPVKVDTFMGQVLPEDTFLICSDGLTGYAKEPKVFEVLKQVDLPLQTRGEMLIKSALDAGGGDNVSVILVRVVELDVETDTWEPEATAPPVKFNEFETSNAFATSIRGPLDLSEITADGKGESTEVRAKKNESMYLLVAALIMAVAGIGAYFVLSSSRKAEPIHVIVDPGGAPAQMNAVLHQKGAEDRSVPVVKGENGQSFDLPGAGEYNVDLLAEGYLPNSVKLSVPSDLATIKLNPLNWVQRPVITLLLPDSPPVVRIRVLHDPVDRPEVKDVVLEKAEIEKAGKKIEVPLWPDATYYVVAEAAGKADYKATQPLTAGQNPQLRVYFEGDAGAQP
jgi:protein phosphatase